MAEIHNQRSKIDPLQLRKYQVEIDNMTEIGFSKFTEPEESFAESKYREGKDQDFPRKQRGMRDYPTVDFERGVFKDEDVVWEWEVSGERKNIDVVRLDHLRNEAKRFRLYNAFPVGYKPGEGDALSEDGLVIETLTVAYEWFEIV